MDGGRPERLEAAARKMRNEANFRSPTSPSHRFATGPSLSALRGGEGWGEVGAGYGTKPISPNEGNYVLDKYDGRL
jgi:hypothetical protein